MPRRHQQLETGQVFAIPLRDSRFAVGQIADNEVKVLGSVTVALHSITLEAPTELAAQPKLDRSTVVAVLYTDRIYLERRRWPVIGTQPVDIPPAFFPAGHDLARETLGRRLDDSNSIETFMNAFHGLAPWDQYYKPDLMDEMLLSPDKKPKTGLIYCGRHGPPPPGGKLVTWPPPEQAAE